MTRTKNLLVIMSDEHQARALSCAGHPLVKTPNLDRLAARGIRFSNAYTPSPICVPARAAFASGRYVHDIRLWDNAMPYTGKPRGWGHALQDKGIRVESIGKLHYRSEEDPAGFDVEHIPMQVANGVGMVWGSIRREDERVRKEGRMLGPYIGPGDSTYTRYDQAVIARTEAWLKEAATDENPWCLYVGLVAPHFPLIVPQEYLDFYPLDSLPPFKLHTMDGFENHPWVAKQNYALLGDDGFTDHAERKLAAACYFALCSFLDDNIGRLMAALEANGQLEETTILYTSDHGDNVGARGLWGKSNMYEESVAVPMILAGPDIPATTCTTPVSLLDVSQTIIDHFGACLEGERPGESLYDLATRAVDPERVIFSEYHAVGAVSGAYMVRKGRWKLIHYHDFAPELFDLDSDPEETTNRAADPECADVLAELYEALNMICDPAAMNDLAFADQDAMIAEYGGPEHAMHMGAPAATPPPET
ncbi:sulfatase-like hydrolase/transferase [Tritonibacter mobilis]|uniref:Sulfatase n=1 Tax=Tritonibacter mobilis F1926 TaxID=1265309 RepID=A0A1B1A8A5_9RHOB|nr:sulfatase-like hydrolase/transferase [Tritonibacter mobilis]ANP42809.1 sulfatase [Tritonibacter mobilis F1926]KJZ23357.1 sulfatase [Tritonibacter mobilis]